MSDRTSISVETPVKERLREWKAPGESWSACLDRLVDTVQSLDADDEFTADSSAGDEFTMNSDPAAAEFPLTEDHIDDIAAATARRTADELEDRLTRR